MQISRAFLFVVVRFVVKNRHGSIQLFYEDDANHLMRKGHAAEGNLFVGSFINRFAESVWTAYDEDQTFGHALHLLG